MVIIGAGGVHCREVVRLLDWRFHCTILLFEQLILYGLLRWHSPLPCQVRALLMPQPMRELRVKNAYVNHKVIIASQGIKITAKDLEKTLAGTPIFVAKKSDEIEVLKVSSPFSLHHFFLCLSKILCNHFSSHFFLPFFSSHFFLPFFPPIILRNVHIAGKYLHKREKNTI